MDDQVKIRGFRVEPGEVQAVLNQHPAVGDCLVLSREYESDDPDRPPGSTRQLVAYIVGKLPAALTAEEMRQFLRETVPHYMVPGVFVFLDRLPINTSGKVDRRALPAPEPGRHRARAAYVGPRDELELQLASLWRDLLNLRLVGVNDNFFDLGGHSLLGAALFARISRVFGRDLTLSTLFEAPTVAELAQVLRQRGWTPPGTAVIPVQPHGTRPPFFCVSRGVFPCNTLATHLGLDQPIFLVKRPGLAGDELPFAQIEAMAMQLVEDIREVQPDGPYFLGGFSLDGLIAVEIARLLREQGHQLGLVVLFETGFPGKRSAKTSGGHRDGSGFVSEFSHRWKWLKHERWGARSFYLHEVFEKRIKLPLKVQSIKVVYRFCQMIGRPVPQTFQDRGWVKKEAVRSGSGYRRSEYPFPLTLFRAMDRNVPDKYPRPDMGWNEVVLGGVEVHEAPGGHRNILREPNIEATARELKDCLSRAQGARPTGH